MFELEERNLSSIWASVESSASWSPWDISPKLQVEYLRMKEPFSQGYWVKKYDISGRTSIFRTYPDNTKLHLYYLYKCIDRNRYTCQLPQWQVENYNYRILSNACLSTYKRLPPIEYSIDGDIVNIHLNYLPPPQALAFLKLYSWPNSCISFPSDFKRKISLTVFKPIQKMFTKMGYTFKER